MFNKFAISVAAMAFAGTAMVCGPAAAHHSYAMFDDQITLTVPATVKDWEWTNPHTFLEVVDDTNGKDWALESASPSLLSRNGINRNTFKTGDRVTVRLHPRRDKAEGGSLQSVTLADGRTLLFEAGRPPAGGPPGGGPPGGRPGGPPPQPQQ